MTSSPTQNLYDLLTLLPPELAGSWIATDQDIDEPLDRAIETRVKQFNLVRTSVCGFPENENRILILYVAERPLKEGVLFPVTWKLGVPDDRRLPNSILEVARLVRDTLSGADQDSRYRFIYQNWGLRFSKEDLEPYYPEAEEADLDTHNMPRALDALFPLGGNSAAYSASPTLLASLYTLVRGGRLKANVLATGDTIRCQVDGIQFIDSIATVGQTLRRKLKVAYDYMVEKKQDVTLFVPASDSYVANDILANENWSQCNATGMTLKIKPIGPQSGMDNILEAIRPIREALQAEPQPQDPIASQEAYYTSRSTQHLRGQFHVNVMQQGSFVDGLRNKWSSVCEREKPGKTAIITIVSHAWEFPLLDRVVLGGDYSYWILLNDEPDVAGKRDRLNALKLDSNRLYEIDLNTLTDRNAKEQAFFGKVADLIAEAGKERTLVFNLSSGPRNLSVILINQAPIGAFFVLYRGQTDPTNNVPLAGSYDLVVYRKETDGLVRLFGDDPVL